mgnify:CR=1 FL=1
MASGNTSKTKKLTGIILAALIGTPLFFYLNFKLVQILNKLILFQAQFLIYLCIQNYIYPIIQPFLLLLTSQFLYPNSFSTGVSNSSFFQYNPLLFT